MWKDGGKRKEISMKGKKRSYGHRKGFYEFCVKRPMDILGAFLALILLSPLYLLVAFLVWIKLGSPIIFSQRRPGINGTIFTLYKFRTMTDERDEQGSLLSDEKRMTPFGKWLRSTSLDELPEFYNVLRGDMSLVGPRPLLMKYLTLYNKHQMRRHEVRPGFTGFAQVNGRNRLSWEEKFDMDVHYVDHITFKEDMKILVKTIKTVLSRKGINSIGSSTVTPFLGNKEVREHP